MLSGDGGIQAANEGVASALELATGGVLSLPSACGTVVPSLKHEVEPSEGDLNLRLFRAGLVGILGLLLLRFGSIVALEASAEESAMATLWQGNEAVKEELEAGAARFAQDPRLVKSVEHFEARQWEEAEKVLLSMAPPETNAYLAFSLSTLRELQGDIAGCEQMLTCARNQMGARAAAKVDIAIISMQLRRNHMDRAKESTRALIDSIADASEKVRIMDELACLPIMHGLRSFLPEADGISRRALELEPQSLTLKARVERFWSSLGNTLKAGKCWRKYIPTAKWFMTRESQRFTSAWRPNQKVAWTKRRHGARKQRRSFPGSGWSKEWTRS